MGIPEVLLWLVIKDSWFPLWLSTKFRIIFGIFQIAPPTVSVFWYSGNLNGKKKKTLKFF